MDDKQFPIQIDTTLIKMILKSIQEGDLALIKHNLVKYSLDLKAVKDPENEQNASFFAALIKDDKE